MQITDHAPDVDWEQLRPILDEAVSQLGENDRKAVLLRFFKNHSHQEVGAALGLTEDTARKRIARALEKLRAYFSTRGVTATAAILSEAISAHSVQAAPAGLAVNVTQAAISSTAAAGSMGGASFFILLMSTKTKIILAAVILAIVATVAIKLQNTADSTPAINSLPASSRAQGAVPAVRVEKPAVAAVAASGQPLPETPVASAAPAPVAAAVSTALASTPPADFVAKPQAELQDAITVGLHFLESDDLLGFFKTLMPPNALATETRVASVEEFAQLALQQPGMKEKIMQMQQVLDAVKATDPTLSGDGTRATYLFDPPVADHKVVIFNKIGGFWYLSGI